MSLSLVCAFESQVYHIGVDVPAEESKEIIVDIDDTPVSPSSGGGSGSSYICKENWVCGNWTDCVGNDQRRLCEDLNKCGPENDKPITYLKCGVEDDSDYGMTLINTDTGGNGENGVGFLSAITGAVTGAVGTAGAVGIIVFMVLVCGGFVAIRIRKVKRRSEK